MKRKQLHLRLISVTMFAVILFSFFLGKRLVGASYFIVGPILIDATCMIHI